MSCYLESVEPKKGGLEIRVCDLCNPLIPPIIRIFFCEGEGKNVREEGFLSYSEKVYEVPKPSEEVWNIVHQAIALSTPIE
jgi:hypothetical protein